MNFFPHELILPQVPEDTLSWFSLRVEFGDPLSFVVQELLQVEGLVELLFKLSSEGHERAIRSDDLPLGHLSEPDSNIYVARWGVGNHSGAEEAGIIDGHFLTLEAGP